MVSAGSLDAGIPVGPDGYALQQGGEKSAEAKHAYNADQNVRVCADLTGWEDAKKEVEEGELDGGVAENPGDLGSDETLEEIVVSNVVFRVFDA